jgi:hypothetical protein
MLNFVNLFTPSFLSSTSTFRLSTGKFPFPNGTFLSPTGKSCLQTSVQVFVDRNGDVAHVYVVCKATAIEALDRVCHGLTQEYVWQNRFLM